MVPGCRPVTGQLLGSAQLVVTQLPVPTGVGHSVTLYEAQGPPVGGVMVRLAEVGLRGVSLEITGCETSGVATGTGTEVGVAVPFASMPKACSSKKR